MADDGQPQGDDAEWNGLSLEQILAKVDETPDPTLADPLSVQEAVVRQLGGNGTGPVSGRYVYSLVDPLAQILEWVQAGAGRTVGTLPVWVRIWRPDSERGVLFVLSGPRPGDEAELVMMGMRGALSRSVLKAVAHWAFARIGVRRIVARISVDRADLGDLLRRAGFQHEGTARDALGDGADAAVWAMTARGCKWLAHAPSPVPDRDFGPVHSLKVH